MIDIFLKVMGVIFLVLIALVVVVVLVVRARVRAFFRRLSSELSPPLTVELTPIAGDPGWTDESAVRLLTDPLKNLGFERVGAFETDMHGPVMMEVWCDAGRAIYAVVYELEIELVDQPWLDFVTRYRDGSTFTVSNAPLGSDLEQREDHPKRFLNDRNPKRLLNEMLDQRPERPIDPVPIDPVEFKDFFEAHYAEEMKWRAERGEIVPADEDNEGPGILSSLEYDAERADHLYELENQVTEAFLQSTTLSALEWERIRDRVVLIYDGLGEDDLNMIIDEWIEPDERFEERFEAALRDLAARGEGFQPRAAFEALNTRLRNRQRFKRLGSMTEPVPADIYVAPEFERD